VQPRSVNNQRHKSKCDKGCEPKPPCAPPGRKNHHPYFCAPLCPAASRCPGFHVENIFARCNHRIACEVMCAVDFVPLVFESLEPVSRPDTKVGTWPTPAIDTVNVCFNFRFTTYSSTWLPSHKNAANSSGAPVIVAPRLGQRANCYLPGQVDVKQRGEGVRTRTSGSRIRTQTRPQR
jgi:hypothetical protein